MTRDGLSASLDAIGPLVEKLYGAADSREGDRAFLTKDKPAFGGC